MNTTARKLTLALIVFYTFIALIGPQTLFSDTMGLGHAACPFMQHAQSMCAMGPIDHVTYWQQMFVALPANFIYLMIVTSALFLALFILGRANDLSPPVQRLKLYFKLAHGKKLYHFLIQLFSRGILHSQTYA